MSGLFQQIAPFGFAMQRNPFQALQLLSAIGGVQAPQAFAPASGSPQASGLGVVDTTVPALFREPFKGSGLAAGTPEWFGFYQNLMNENGGFQSPGFNAQDQIRQLARNEALAPYTGANAGSVIPQNVMDWVSQLNSLTPQGAQQVFKAPTPPQITVPSQPIATQLGNPAPQERAQQANPFMPRKPALNPFQIF